MDLKPHEYLKDGPVLYTTKEIIEDYRLAYRSRQVSLIGRKEVLTGKAKFGIFGGGKEIPQIAMAKVFRAGDIRSGYYRDQTFAFASDMSTIHQFFAQLYAHPDVEADPFSGGRQMNAHFGTRVLNEDGSWKDLSQELYSSADSAPTASQMTRMVGLVQASALYRKNKNLSTYTHFSKHGNEVVFGTIGNASCAEGQFWEAINAMGVIQGPLIMSIWDDDYGISVPNEFQHTKNNLFEMLSGFQRNEQQRGYEIFQVKAWDYVRLIQVYREAAKLARDEHIPCIIHVDEVTQPQGHSTSGSHERYKSEERLAWEKEWDCLAQLRTYLLDKGYATEEELLAWEKEDRIAVRKIKNEAWGAFINPIKSEAAELMDMLSQLAEATGTQALLENLVDELRRSLEPNRRELMAVSHKALIALRDKSHPFIEQLKDWRKTKFQDGEERYNTFLYSEGQESPFTVQEVRPQYPAEPEMVPGFDILNRAFDVYFDRDPLVVAFGEDVGQLGDVNQGMAGLQKKYGKDRIMDTGIRENTIMGQAIGLAMRGFRPIGEIQYLDYFIYGLQPLSDDLATLRYRTSNGQKAPAIIRTRGHRLEGIWHAGSPMGMLIHALRGMHVCVPRNMTQAAGFYNTLLQGDDPAVVVEVLNGYRLKEPLPSNIGTYCVPLGQPEVLRAGTDVTLVTYGACCRIALAAANQLASLGIEVEVIDVQTLLPFDINHDIVRSLAKTNRLLCLDEDVPGGASAFMMQQILEEQGGYELLDSAPVSHTSQAHRPAFGDDGDYWSKPQVESVVEAVYEIMQEADPQAFPDIF
ncbi:MAG: thiamine pyrophosphate-dependent enzyme [Bacteroidota bacterium]